MHITDNNKSPHGKFYSFLFPFSSKFPDLNFAPYVLMGAIHSTKIQTGPTGKRGPPQKVDPFFRNFSGWTEPIHWVLDRNFRKFWLNGSRPMSHVLTRRVRAWVTYGGTWDQESTKMAPEKRACSKPELYSDFTVCTELQHSGLDSLRSGGLFVVV